MNYVRSINLSLKYHRFTLSGCKDMGIIKSDSIALHPLNQKTALKYVNMKDCNGASRLLLNRSCHISL